jgi:phosphoserine phosphatase RsbU/P
MITKEDLIRRTPLFGSLPAEEVQHLANSLHLSTFPAGSTLFHEGDPGESFAIITDGQVEIIQAYGTPEERTLTIMGPGDFLGEMSLLYPDHRRSATARAQTDVALLEMTSADFELLIHRQVSLAVKLLREMSQRIRRSESLTIRDLQLKNSQLAQALQELQAAQAQLIEKEKLEQELRLARSIQESSLPKEVPVIPGWQVTAYWQPARAVGGDFYDFIPLPDGKLGVIIGDVAGKGMPAALIMATTRSLLYFATLYAKTGGGPIRPGDILARVNEMCCTEIPEGMFVTCLFMIVNLESGLTVFANAGHNLPYRRSSQGIIELRATGMPLGLMPGMDYEEEEAIVREGDSLILTSDGLIEAHNSQGEMYGSKRLQEQLASNAGGAGLIQGLLNHLVEFNGPGTISMRCCPACSSKRLRTRMRLPPFLSITGRLNLRKGACWKIFKLRWRAANRQPKPPAQAKESEQRYQSIFEIASDGLIIHDLETGLVVEANPAACTMYGYARHEFIGLHPDQLHPP